MLKKDYKEMLHLLLEEHVDFILVGAYALAAHGYPESNWRLRYLGQTWV